MGSSYSNITLQGPERDRIIQALEARGRQAYVGPASGGFVVVFETQFVAFDGDCCDTTQRVTEDDVNATLERRQTLLRLRRAILSLPRRYREVIVLCDLQDVSYNDAAVAVGCAVGTIRSRLHRARHLLSQKMGCAMASEEDHQRQSVRCAV
jgi:RNA polymerase sigma factor (sigma-70 family)